MADRGTTCSYTCGHEAKAQSIFKNLRSTEHGDKAPRCEGGIQETAQGPVGVLSGTDFSFEKSKVQGLAIAADISNDVNDEGISKLKLDIMQKYKATLALHSRRIGQLKCIGAGMVLLMSIEGIALFFLMLHLILMSLPQSYIVLLVLPAYILATLSLLSSRQAIFLAPEKDPQACWKMQCLCRGIVAVVATVIVLLFSTMTFTGLSITNALRPEHKQIVEGVLTAHLVLTTLKFIYHVFCLCMLNQLLILSAVLSNRETQQTYPTANRFATF